ncbi:hypothetical protein A2U01_0063086, partial [Trifolium medium]|nr:hypothetical protein [Trifolium medium]
HGHRVTTISRRRRIAFSPVGFGGFGYSEILVGFVFVLPGSVRSPFLPAPVPLARFSPLRLGGIWCC